MANEEHLKILQQGVEQWNKWREANENISPDLEDANLIGVNLCGANLSGANLSLANLIDAFLIDANLKRANLSDANLSDANLRGANLSDAYMRGAHMPGANLSGANLSSTYLCGANLSGANLNEANLTSSDLTNSDLTFTDLVETDFTSATITDCSIYGASAWNVTVVDTVQNNLVVTREGEPVVTTDSLEVGQLICLMLDNTKIRDVINTITSKGVLILGRFSDPQRKSVLDGLKEKLREYDLLAMVFDFDRPTDKDFTETVQTLAAMSMFVIVDVTNPKSTPLELEATVKQCKIPYIPIIDISVDPHPFAMLVDLQKSFHWVLPTLNYESKEQLLDDENLKTYVVDREVAKRIELREAKNQEPEPLVILKKR